MTAILSGKFLVLLYALVTIAHASKNIPQIVGGKRATRKVRRHLVKLELYYENGDSSICSGSILDRRHILSAAHCVYSSSETVEKAYSYVYVGQKRSEPRNAEAFYFEKVWIPDEYYADEDSRFDIAVVKLDTEIPDELYYPIRIAKEPKPDKKVIAAGYGLTSDGGSDSKYAMQTTVISKSFDECYENDYEEAQDILSEKYHVCAVSKGWPDKGRTDSCRTYSTNPILTFSAHTILTFFLKYLPSFVP